MEINEIYTKLIVAHSQKNHNKHHIDKPTIIDFGHNPNCGDEITLELRLDGDSIVDAGYTGSGCVISQASASIMIDLVKYKTKKEASELIDKFLKMVNNKTDENASLNELKDAIEFKKISNTPARIKCAVLAWDTLKIMID